MFKLRLRKSTNNGVRNVTDTRLDREEILRETPLGDFVLEEFN
jgi:hypothetical protein